MNKLIVGKKLKYIRELNNLTMDKLKEEFNRNYGTSISKSMISNRENGHYLISNKNLNIYVQFFNAPLAYFTKDYVKAEDYEAFKKQAEKIDSLLLKFNIDDDFYSDYIHYAIHEINEYLEYLNADGVNKVLEFTKDIYKIDDYTLNDYDNNSKEKNEE
ncbi:helix-turn-helix transcriptional regulator [Anaerococcus sp. Marseille-P3625]|uniref:helix-turn-helix domain-containing protein n=1 Tax=Anaerococcus sp. Marseille-P3625 TaxID=1977277 RepID=UPI000C07291F|nr:helix-turn-helix transcriptional regulator [Anaerococcus sp. Marseille-P3625]